MEPLILIDWKKRGWQKYWYCGWSLTRRVIFVSLNSVHFSSFRGCLVGRSYRPILCSFQLTIVSILKIKNFLLRNVYLFDFPLFTSFTSVLLWSYKDDIWWVDNGTTFILVFRIRALATPRKSASLKIKAFVLLWMLWGFPILFVYKWTDKAHWSKYSGNEWFTVVCSRCRQNGKFGHFPV